MSWWGVSGSFRETDALELLFQESKTKGLFTKVSTVFRDPTKDPAIPLS